MDPTVLTAIVSLVSAIIGGCITIAGNFALHWIQDRPRRKLDAKRKQHLEEMLRNPKYPGHWRTIKTLSRVIGASADTTTALLIELGARGSEKDDGLWTLLEYHPLDELGQ